MHPNWIYWIVPYIAPTGTTQKRATPQFVCPRQYNNFVPQFSLVFFFIWFLQSCTYYYYYDGHMGWYLFRPLTLKINRYVIYRIWKPRRFLNLNEQFQYKVSVSILPIYAHMSYMYISDIIISYYNFVLNSKINRMFIHWIYYSCELYEL